MAWRWRYAIFIFAVPYFFTAAPGENCFVFERMKKREKRKTNEHYSHALLINERTLPAHTYRRVKLENGRKPNLLVCPTSAAAVIIAIAVYLYYVHQLMCTI